MSENVDVLIIGAGPAGSVAASFLHQQGIKVLVVDKEKFPRFVIGESLLPICTGILEEAGLLHAVKAHGFQFKNGAAFSWGDRYKYFDFCDKSSAGYGTTFQVQRGDFDKLLIDEVAKKGVEVRFQTAVTSVKFATTSGELNEATLDNGEKIKAKFVLDASGYGRVLPRLLDLEKESNLSPKRAYFTHIEDNISEILYDRQKILITTHPKMRGVWYWLIPFSNGRASLGVVGEPHLIDDDKMNEMEILQKLVFETPMLKRLLNNAKFDMPARTLFGYSKDVKQLYGDNFLLLGNAGEFLDPVFSSGVSIALYSSRLAGRLIPRILKGEKVNLEEEYAKPLMVGVNTFRTYVEGWYDGSFQNVIYAKNENQDVKRQICSILAGYAWDTNNPYVTRSKEALIALEKFCEV